MRCWAIVPVKRLTAAKSRLAPVLSLRRRRELVTSLLIRTLTVLSKVKRIEGILIVGKDNAVRKIAREFGAGFVKEKEQDGLNGALTRAAREAVRRGADALMILPADLPLLKPADLAWALTRAGTPPFLAIAPDRAGRGTNLLCLAPPGLIRFSFGERSFLRHVTAARRAGSKVKVLRRRSLAEDIDRPEDLKLVKVSFGTGGKPPRTPPRAAPWAGRGSTKRT
jgi:2-phospho-L-lactate guanylyltransferase